MSPCLVPLLTDPLSPLYTASEWMFVVKQNFVVQGDFPVTLKWGTLLMGKDTLHAPKDRRGAQWSIWSSRVTVSLRDHDSLSSLTEPPTNFWFNYSERGEQREYFCLPAARPFTPGSDS